MISSLLPRASVKQGDRPLNIGKRLGIGNGQVKLLQETK